MANLFTKLIEGFTTKSTFNSSSLYTTGLSIIGNFFGSNKGKHSFKNYTDSYGNNPLVYMVINKIATTSASIKRVVLDDNGEEVSNSDLLSMVSVDLYEQMFEQLLTTGNIFILKITSIGGLGSELKVLQSKNVDIKVGASGEVVGYYYLDIFGRKLNYSSDEVLQIKTSNIVNTNVVDSLYGLSTLQSIWKVVCSSDEKLNADSAIFKNRGIVGILTNDSDMAMLPKERERLQAEYDKEIGGSDKFNSIKVSTSKLKYIQTGMSPSDLKLLEGIMSSLRLICSAFGLSSVLFNDNDNSTYNNVSEAKKSAYTDVYLPISQKVDKQLSSWLSDTEVLSLDTTSIEVLKMSGSDVADSINNLTPQVGRLVSEQLTVNELRAIAGLEEIKGGNVLPKTTTNGETKVN